METIIITTKIPYLTACGGTRRLNSIIDACKINNEKLKIVTLRLGFRKSISTKKKNDDILIQIKIPIYDILCNIAKTIVLGGSLQGRLFYSAWAERKIIESRDESNLKIIFHHMRTYRYSSAIKGVNKYLDIVDLMSLAMRARRHSYRKNASFHRIIYTFYNNIIAAFEENRLKTEEIELTSIFDRIIFASERDLIEYRNRIDPKHVHKLHLGPIVTNPNFGGELATRGISNDNQSKSSSVKKIGFHGDFNYPPNYEAALCLVDVIFPMILSKFDNVTLNLIGNGSVDFLNGFKPKNSKNIVAHGFVEDLEGVLEKNNLLLIPIFSGAGVQNKIIDGIQLGIPVVASNYTVNALPNAMQKFVKSGSNPDQLVELAIEILSSATDINYKNHKDAALIATNEMLQQFLGSLK